MLMWVHAYNTYYILYFRPTPCKLICVLMSLYSSIKIKYNVSIEILHDD